MDFKKLLESNLFDLICFIVGMIIGLILICIIYMIVVLINKKITKKRKIKNKEKIYLDQTNIINNYIIKYDTLAAKKNLSTKLETFKNISFQLVNDIAVKYYPQSPNPLGELSIEDLIKIIQTIEDEINEIITSILEHKACKTLYTLSRGSINIINFFKKKEDRISEKNLEDLKISRIIQIYDQLALKNNEEDTKKESAPFFIINNLINKKIIGLIKDIGNLANKAYSRGLRDEYYDS